MAPSAPGGEVPGCGRAVGAADLVVKVAAPGRHGATRLGALLVTDTDECSEAGCGVVAGFGPIDDDDRGEHGAEAFPRPARVGFGWLDGLVDLDRCAGVGVDPQPAQPRGRQHEAHLLGAHLPVALDESSPVVGLQQRRDRDVHVDNDGRVQPLPSQHLQLPWRRLTAGGLPLALALALEQQVQEAGGEPGPDVSPALVLRPDDTARQVGPPLGGGEGLEVGLPAG